MLDFSRYVFPEHALPIRCHGDSCDIKEYMQKFRFLSEVQAGLGKTHPGAHAIARKEAKEFGARHDHHLETMGAQHEVDFEVRVQVTLFTSDSLECLVFDLYYP